MLSLALAVLLIGLPAFAKEVKKAPPSKAPSPPSGFLRELKNACGEDAKAVCKGIPPADARLMKCLASHRDELSELCRVFALGPRKSAEVAGKSSLERACKDDAKRFCPGLKAAGGKLLRCLEEREPDLSDDCYDVVFPPEGVDEGPTRGDG